MMAIIKNPDSMFIGDERISGMVSNMEKASISATPLRNTPRIL